MTVETKRTISYLLRHDRGTRGLLRDKHGWVSVDNLLATLAEKHPTTYDELVDAVETDDKGRYQLDRTEGRIRALYGHSVPVELDFEPETPPDSLFHGTAERNVASIMKEGLLPRSRQFVHLSSDACIATNVGARHGTPILLLVDTAAMLRDGYLFYHPVSHTWLTRVVPPQYLRLM